MRKKHLQQSIRSAIMHLLNEESDPDKNPGKKKKPAKPAKGPAPGSISIAPGGIGRGRFNRFVSEAKARSEKDPEGLIEDLGIKGGSGNDLSQVTQIFNEAILTNDVMGEAYSGAAQKVVKNKEGKNVKVVAITPSGLNERNGIKFLAYTLQAAKAAGVFSPTGAIVFSRGEYFPIEVYSL